MFASMTSEVAETSSEAALKAGKTKWYFVMRFFYSILKLCLHLVSLLFTFWISGLPEDTRYTMDQFLQGLDPEMTSTQQTQFTEDPSMVCLLILFFFLNLCVFAFSRFFFHGNKKILKFIHIFFPCRNWRIYSWQIIWFV